MRQELIGYLWGLSNLQYQKDCWVNNMCPDEVEYDEFDYTVHFLFDDTQLSSNANSLIGFILKDESEAMSVQEVCQRISDIFDIYGTELSDREYISCSEWSTVIYAAKEAHNILASGF